MNRHSLDLVSLIFGGLFLLLALATGFATSLAWLIPALRWDLIAPVLLILIGGWLLTRTALRDRGKDSTGGPEELGIPAE
jgi:hypothetical protein